MSTCAVVVQKSDCEQHILLLLSGLILIWGVPCCHYGDITGHFERGLELKHLLH